MYSVGHTVTYYRFHNEMLPMFCLLFVCVFIVCVGGVQLLKSLLVELGKEQLRDVAL